MQKRVPGMMSLLILLIFILGALALPACDGQNPPATQTGQTTAANPFTPVQKTTTTNPFTPVQKTTTANPTTTAPNPATTTATTPPTTTTTPTPTTTTAAPTTTTPTTTAVQSDEPVEVIGQDPESIPLYPGSIRVAYITMCACTPTVTTWYAAPDDQKTVLEYYVNALEDDGWEVNMEPTGDALWAFKDSEDDIFINVLESETWEEYPAEINIFWYNWDHFEEAGSN